MNTRCCIHLPVELSQLPAGGDAALPAERAVGFAPAEDTPRLVTRPCIALGFPDENRRLLPIFF